MPNDKRPMLGHMAVLTNQILVYKHREVIPRIVSIAKMLKLSPKINLGISSDLGITIVRGLSFVSKTCPVWVSGPKSGIIVE